MNKLPLYIILLLLLVTAAHAANTEAEQSQGIYYFCPYVIDGDTLVVIIDGKKEKVRLIGVDTPEKDGPYTKEEAFGKEASAFTRNKAEGKKVRLEYGRQRRDRYGRILAYVHLGDGTFLNAELVRQGYATVYRRFPFKYRDDFDGYELEARNNKRGLWKLLQ